MTTFPFEAFRIHYLTLCAPVCFLFELVFDVVVCWRTMSLKLSNSVYVVNSTDERTGLLRSENLVLTLYRPAANESAQLCNESVENEAAAETMAFTSSSPSHTDIPQDPRVVTPLPRKQLLAILLLQAAQPLAFELVMPFISQCSSWCFHILFYACVLTFAYRSNDS